MENTYTIIGKDEAPVAPTFHQEQAHNIYNQNKGYYFTMIPFSKPKGATVTVRAGHIDDEYLR